ncbi:MAG TPA: putative amino-acid ABC transporter-binding protein YhdW [Hyphomicrobiaceae bacterium MAG_BT-2024]
MGFLIRKSYKVISALEFSGANICVVTGSIAHVSLKQFFAPRGMDIAIKGSDTWSGVISQFTSEECIVIAADNARLALERKKFDRPEQLALLAEIASIEMFGPVVSSDDWRWFKIVR